MTDETRQSPTNAVSHATPAIRVSIAANEARTCGGTRSALVISTEGYSGEMLADADGRFDLQMVIHSLQLLQRQLTNSHRPEGA